MSRVLFFAKLREDLACSELTVSLMEPISGRSQFIAVIAKHIESMQSDADAQLFVQKLSAVNIVMAVNHKVCNGEVIIQPGDEVAFYPPVTGG